MNDLTHLTRAALWALLPIVLLASRPAAALTIADNPLSIPTPLAPNIVLTLDDSGSMYKAYAPDTIGAPQAQGNKPPYNARRYKSAVFNSLYYDPGVLYPPPLDASGNPLSTSFSVAYINGFDTSRGAVDLSSNYRPTLIYDPSSGTQTFADHPGGGNSGTTAYYYVFDASNGGCDGTAGDDNCYDKVDVDATSGPGGTDERQNFANWYSFYRTRNLMTVTAASRAFAGLKGTERVAWQALNSCNSFDASTNLFASACQGWDGITQDHRIRQFQGSHKTAFYAWLARLPTVGDTPLRSAMERAGKYFSSSGVSSPYAEDPQVSAGTEYACRPNFHIVMTDGLWTAETLANPPGNADAAAAKAPFQDGNTDSLADIAYHYWATDLRGDLANNLIAYKPEGDDYWNPKNDPATWQHMVNFTVGLGLSKTLVSPNPVWAGDTYAGGYADLLSGTAWPPTAADASPGNVYDLWHAALNSRGRFFGADNPDGLTTAFSSILGQIADEGTSSTALAANATRLDTGTMIFQAKFDSGDWSGKLLAFSVDVSTGAVDTLNPLWESSIPAAGSRAIYTWDGSAGTAFSGGTIEAAVGGADVLDYLRGNQTQEQPNGAYRKRGSLLGDIINSDPAYAGAYDYGYGALSADYNTFVNTNKTRTRMLYVGANDGMLHAFNAATGVEVFAYVPSAVIPNLALLSDPAYTHRYYVDGAPYVGDAYLGSAWKTLLLGTTGAGGRAVFALDVTDPDNFDATKVLWEFTSATDADLGHTLGQPVIARMKDGNWYAVFGNGYNSANGHAVLFIVNLANGTLAKKFDLGGTDNGLATPALYDADGDRITDAIYAGDNEGNLWKFDVSDADPNLWGVAYSGTPLFSARDAGGNAQPITAPLELGNPPSGRTGVMVFFGTGRYFAVGDNTSNAVQSLYGILDSDSAVGVTDRSTLQQQTILYQGAHVDENGVAVSAAKVRATSNSQVDYATQRGWYLDLNYPSAQGERVVSTPLLRHGRVIYTTLIPSSDPCDGGGNSWIMELDANSGSRLDYSVFNLNDDDAFDSVDYVKVGGVWVPVSGLGYDSIVSTPTVLTPTGAISTCPPGSELKLVPDSSGNVTPLCESMGGVLTGRVSWREILD